MLVEAYISTSITQSLLSCGKISIVLLEHLDIQHSQKKPVLYIWTLKEAVCTSLYLIDHWSMKMNKSWNPPEQVLTSGDVFVLSKEIIGSRRAELLIRMIVIS